MPNHQHPSGSRVEQLRRRLHVWSLATTAVNAHGYQEELAAVRVGAASTTQLDDAIHV
jgi:hypothetical protein